MYERIFTGELFKILLMHFHQIGKELFFIREIFYKIILKNSPKGYAILHKNFPYIIQIT